MGGSAPVFFPGIFSPFGRNWKLDPVPHNDPVEDILKSVMKKKQLKVDHLPFSW
jgi:hypothetical protein